MKATRVISKTASAYPYPLLIKQLLLTPIYYAPDQEIVYRNSKRYKYKDLYRRINQLASGLISQGVEPGDTVAVLDWDSHRYLECFFAIPMIGAILHTVNVRLSPEQILFTMNHAEDKWVLIHEEFLPLMENIVEQLKITPRFILMKERDEGTSTLLPIMIEYENMLEISKSSFEFPDFSEDTQATLFYTTGTTGEPKGVSFSHRHLVIHAMTLALVWGSFAGGRFTTRDVYMPLTPMFHVQAWGAPYVATLLGVKQVYPGRYEPEVILDLLEKEKVTFSHCVPTILNILLNHPLAKTINLTNWKVNVGGSPLSRNLARAAMEVGVDVMSGYGMSEACPSITLATLKPNMLDWGIERQLDIRIGGGFPFPFVDLRVVNESIDIPLPRDGRSTGEIVVRSPWLTQGYHKNSQKSEELWKDGWLHTGDIGTIDQEGYVQIKDRVKDVIKSGGEWISSLELECILSQHESISEVAVFGVPDSKWGERPMALIVLKPDCQEIVSKHRLKSFLEEFVKRGALPKWAIPDKIFVVENIPKTSVGKIDKKEIRHKFADNAFKNAFLK